MDYAEEIKLQQVLVYSLAIIVWMKSFQIPKIQAAFFCDGNDIAGHSNRGGLNLHSTKWNTKTIESQKSSLGPYWTFLVLTALQIEDNRH